MQFGPLTHAIDKLLSIYLAKPPKKDREGNDEFRIKITLAWDEIGQAQDQFYEAVKNGTITKGD